MLEYNIDLTGKTILVTGAAGFIGSNLVKRLLNDFEPIKVIGIDSITDYYDVNLKYERLKEIEVYPKIGRSSKVALQTKPSLIRYLRKTRLMWW